MSNWLNSHNWQENIPCPVNRVDLDRWQSELDSIVGVEDDGTKRWRFVWGQDLENAITWNRYLREWMPRYPAGSTVDFVANPATGILERQRTWFGVPRLFAEALIPRVHRNEQVERAGVDPDGDVFTERRTPGPEYTMLFCVTQHDERKRDNWRFCCLRRLRKKQTCYGHYRPPDQNDIDTLHEDYNLRVISKLCRPDEKPTDADKTFFYYSWMLQHLREEKQRNSELDYHSDHVMKTLAQWPGTSFQSKKNRYSIPSQVNNERPRNLSGN